ncbi:MAG: helix-turn-helix transcriptional regulator [Lachnospiraceae bacterium]|nr:helix-turn-helix transcriptional regulator [Lachnospiraceae bacterium]
MNTLHIGENILKYRHGKRITQEEVARYLGVTKASVSKWENAQSFPDVTLLPQIAAFFGVSVDELMGYESALTSDQIQKIYHDLCKGFAAGEVKETFVIANAYIRNHYSCHPFLNKMSTLFLNHYMLLETKEEQNAILEQIKKMCSKVLSESNVSLERQLALSMKCYADLALGHPEYVINALEPLAGPEDLLMGNQTLLIQAYRDAGKTDKATTYTQVYMYANIMSQVYHSMTYIGHNMDNATIAKSTIATTINLIDLYKVSSLNPNLTAQFFYVAANYYASVSNATETLNMLDKYADSVSELFTGELGLRGNDYFDKVVEWLDSKNDSEVPRDVHLIAKNAIEVLDNPVFSFVQSTDEMKRFKTRITRASEILEKNNK